MKDEVTKQQISPKSTRYTFFLEKIWLKNFSLTVLKFKQKIPVDLNSGSMVYKTKALDHGAMIVDSQLDWYKQFDKIFQLPYCDVVSYTV